MPLLVCLQPAKLSDTQAPPTSWLGGVIRGLQPGGHVHKAAAHLLSLQPASFTSSSAFEPECNGLSQSREDTGKPSMPVREFNLIACLLVQLAYLSVHLVGVSPSTWNFPPKWPTPFKDVDIHRTFWLWGGPAYLRLVYHIHSTPVCHMCQCNTYFLALTSNSREKLLYSLSIYSLSPMHLQTSRRSL